MIVTSVQPSGGPVVADQKQPQQPQAAAPAEASAAQVPQQFFVSPTVRIDSGVPVVQFRDGGTGQVTLQIPSEKALEAYKANLTIGKPAPLGVDIPRGSAAQPAQDEAAASETQQTAAETAPPVERAEATEAEPQS